MPIRCRHCCEEPERVLVWIAIAATATNVVEGCVYLRRRHCAISGMLSGGEFELFALRYPLSALRSFLCPLNVVVRASGLGLYEHTSTQL